MTSSASLLPTGEPIVGDQQPAPTSFPFLELPTVLAGLIMDCLDSLSVVRLRQMSRQFRAVADEELGRRRRLDALPADGWDERLVAAFVGRFHVDDLRVYVPFVPGESDARQLDSFRPAANPFLGMDRPFAFDPAVWQAIFLTRPLRQFHILAQPFWRADKQTWVEWHLMRPFWCEHDQGDDELCDECLELDGKKGVFSTQALEPLLTGFVDAQRRACSELEAFVISPVAFMKVQVPGDVYTFGLSSEDVVALLQSTQGTLRKLSVSLDPSGELQRCRSGDWNGEPIVQAASLCRRLEVLEMDGVFDYNTVSMLTFRRLVQSCSLKCLPDFMTGGEPVHFEDMSPLYDAWAAHGQNLQFMWEAPLQGRGTCAALTALVARAPKLQVLDLDRFDIVPSTFRGGELLKTIGRHCSRIAHISSSDLFGLEDAVHDWDDRDWLRGRARAGIVHEPSVGYGADPLDDECLRALGANCHALVRLRMHAHFYDISGAGLRALLAGCPALKELTLCEPFAIKHVRPAFSLTDMPAFAFDEGPHASTQHPTLVIPTPFSLNRLSLDDALLSFADRCCQHEGSTVADWTLSIDPSSLAAYLPFAVVARPGDESPQGRERDGRAVYEALCMFSLRVEDFVRALFDDAPLSAGLVGHLAADRRHRLLALHERLVEARRRCPHMTLPSRFVGLFWHWPGDDTVRGVPYDCEEYWDGPCAPSGEGACKAPLCAAGPYGGRRDRPRRTPMCQVYEKCLGEQWPADEVPYVLPDPPLPVTRLVLSSTPPTATASIPSLDYDVDLATPAALPAATFADPSKLTVRRIGVSCRLRLPLVGPEHKCGAWRCTGRWGQCAGVRAAALEISDDRQD